MRIPENDFYASSNNGFLQEFKDLQSSFNSNPRYVLHLESKIVPNGTYNNLFIECILYDGNTKEQLTKISNWLISEFETKQDGYMKTTLSLKIKDSNDVIKAIEFKNIHCNQVRLFDLLIALELAKNWKDYQTQHLAAEILAIEKKILDLKQNLKSIIFDLEEEYKKSKHTLKSNIRRLKKDGLKLDKIIIN